MAIDRRIKVLCTQDIVHEGATNTVRREIARRLDRKRFQVSATSFHTPRQPHRNSFLSHYDIVHLDISYLPYLLLRLKNPKTAFIQTVHSITETRRTYTHLGSRVYHRYIAPSAFIAHELQRRCRIRAHIVYNGVDRRLFNPSNRDPELLEKMGIQQPSFLFAGRFAPSKRIDLLLRTAATVKEAVFVLKGSGPLLLQIEEERHKMDLRNLRVLPRSPHSSIELRKLFASCTAYLQSSENEAGPLSILEAMSSGTPVISVLSGCTPELVEHEKTGLLTPPGNSELLAQACRRLIDDPEARRIMGKAASERARRDFTWEKAAHRHEAIYEDMLEKR